MPQLRLRIFAYHVQEIATAKAPTEFGLSTCDGGKKYRVKIEKSQKHGPEWDTVYIDGRNCGNRHAGVAHFASLIQAEAPTIHPDDDRQHGDDKR